MYLIPILNKIIDSNKYFSYFRNEKASGYTLLHTPEYLQRAQLLDSNLFSKWPHVLTTFHQTYHFDIKKDFPVARRHFYILAAKCLADEAAKERGIQTSHVDFDPNQITLDTSKIKIEELAVHIFTSLYEHSASTTQLSTKGFEGYETDCEKGPLRRTIKKITACNDLPPAIPDREDSPREVTIDLGYEADDENGISSGDDSIPDLPACQLMTKALRPTPFIVLDTRAQKTTRSKDAVLNELKSRFK